MRTFPPRIRADNILAHDPTPTSDWQPPEDREPSTHLIRTTVTPPLPPINRPPTPAPTPPATLTTQTHSVIPRTGPQPFNINATISIPPGSLKGIAQDPLYERLVENERAQRALAIETARLHAELGERLRFCDGVLRDEVHTRRVLEDHISFLRTLIDHLHSQSNATSHHLSLSHDVVLQSIEMSQRNASDHSQFVASVAQQRDEDRTIISSQIAALSQRLDAVVEDIRRCMHNVEIMGNEFRNQISGIESRMTQMESTSSTLSNTLQEALSQTNATHSTDLAQLRTEMLAQNNTHDDTDSFLKSQITTILQQLTNHDTALSNLEQKLTADLNTKLAQLESTTQAMKNDHANETRQLLKAIQAIHSVIKGSREEERRGRDIVKKEVLRAKAELRSEMDEIKEDLAGQIRNMNKPFIVI